MTRCRGPGSGSYSDRCPSHGRRGTRRSRRRPDQQGPRSSGERTPPGKRQLMPTIAIGSSATDTVEHAWAPNRPAGSAEQLGPQVLGERGRPSDSRRPASREGSTRHAAPRRLRSSTAVSESKPSSLNARSAWTASAPVAEHGGAWYAPGRAVPVLFGGGHSGQPLHQRTVHPASSSPRRHQDAPAASGRSPRNALGRGQSPGANRPQSISASVEAASPSPPPRPWHDRQPRGHRRRPHRGATAPPQSPSAPYRAAHAPQAIEVPARPSARRNSASASRNALAAA